MNDVSDLARLHPSKLSAAMHAAMDRLRPGRLAIGSGLTRKEADGGTQSLEASGGGGRGDIATTYLQMLQSSWM